MLRVGEQASAGFSVDAHVEESGIEPLDIDYPNRHSPRQHSPTGTHLPPLGTQATFVIILWFTGTFTVTTRLVTILHYHLRYIVLL